MSLSNSIDIYYDGTDISRYIDNINVSGVTTNTSFLKQSEISNYKQFVQDAIRNIGNKPISFQVFGDEFDEIFRQATTLNSWNTNNSTVFIKVPIMNTKGEYNIDVIQTLINKGVRVNITSVYTKEQLERISKLETHNKNNTIVSIFAGRIADTGVLPFDILDYAYSLFKQNSKFRVLYAACRSILEILIAIKHKCHIVTVPGGVIDRLTRVGKTLNDFSLETIKNFRNDAISVGLKIES